MSDESSKSQGELAYQKLLAAIRSGAYAPGARLRETEISERLALSRTPIREALRKLEAQEIVEHRPRLGAVVRQLSQQEVVELYEMRVVLEGTAAAMAAQHASEAEIAALREINEELATTIAQPAQAAATNEWFHRGIYQATRNRFLVQAARGLNDALMLLGPTTLADQARIETVCREHAQIIAAIEARDPGGARAAAEAHLQTGLRVRLRVLRQ